MKKIRVSATIGLLCAFCVCMAETQPTTDQMVVGDVTLTPGGENAYFTLSLKGETFSFL